MATYAELFTIAAQNQILDKVTAAVAIQAEAIRNEAGGTSNHANRLIWAKTVFSDPRQMAIKMVWAILAQNAAATASQIVNATDAATLTAVANAVDVFATGT
jgi:hypothetical protein